MGKIYQCVGHYAETPYTIRRTWLRVYCVEELCYYICNNAYLLEEDFISPELLMWLDSECMLSSLAKTLRAQIRQGTKLEEQIRLLLETVHYCPGEEIDEIIGMVAANDHMSSLQKNKVRADYFLKNERYALALRSYEDIMEELKETGDCQLTASVYYNMGVIYARLFLLTHAGEYFKKAYEEYEEETYRTAYLTVLRMTLPDGEYLKQVAEDEVFFQASKVVEFNLDQVEQNWKKSEEQLKIRELYRMRETGNIEAYSKQVEQMNSAYKEQYRNMVID